MKRLDRHQLIKTLINQAPITTQESLKKQLEALGVTVTQATLSRDIRELGLVKVTDNKGKRRYTLPEETFSLAVPGLVLAVSRAEFMLVLKTELGNADVLANIIDAENKPDILGTVAGADTLLVICQDKDIAATYEAALKKR